MRKSIFITAVLALTEIRESAKVTGASMTLDMRVNFEPKLEKK